MEVLLEGVNPQVAGGANPGLFELAPLRVAGLLRGSEATAFRALWRARVPRPSLSCLACSLPPPLCCRRTLPRPHPVPSPGSEARVLAPRSPCYPGGAGASGGRGPSIPARYGSPVAADRLPAPRGASMGVDVGGCPWSPHKPGGCLSQSPDPEELGLLWVGENGALSSPEGTPGLPTGSLPGTGTLGSVILWACPPGWPRSRSTRGCLGDGGTVSAWLLITVPVSAQQDGLEAAGPLPVLCSVPSVFQPSGTFYQRLCGDCGLSAAQHT